MPIRYSKDTVLSGGGTDHELEKLVAPQADLQWRWKYDPKLNHILIGIVYIHLAGIYGLTMFFSAKWTTLVFLYIYFVAGILGISMGAHRLWSHRSYKAKLPLQIILMFCFSCVLQNSAQWWCENHRQHHKYSDTDADPHNSTRGVFFSHIGWFLVKPHPEVIKRRPMVDISDLKNDPVLSFQKRYLTPILVTMSFIIPSVVPWCLGEYFFVAWHLNMFRLIVTYHCTFSVNSLTHWLGSKPYDKNIVPTQNITVSFVSFGEGFHNYHHTFPWDYRVAELGNNRLNFSTFMIDLVSKIGWAYDLKTASQEIINARAARTGDGTDSWGSKL